MIGLNRHTGSKHLYDSKENIDDATCNKPNSFCHNDNDVAEWQKTGMQVSAETREQIIMNQKNAVLRRRKQQLQSGFIKSINTQVTKKLDNDPHVVPTVRTYYATSKQQNDDAKMNENPRQEETQRIHSNVRLSKPLEGERPSIDNSMDMKAKDDVMKSYDISCDTRKGSQNILPHNHYESSCGSLAIEMDSRRQRRLARSPSTLSNMSNDLSEADTFQTEIKQSNSIIVNRCTSVPDDDEHTELSSEDDKQEKQFCRSIPGTIINNIWEKVDWNNLEMLKKFVMAPCPKEAGMVKCYIRRFKGKAKLFPEYRVYLQEGDIFLMTSKKRAKKQSSNYLISVERNDHDKNSCNIIGKLRANFLGTEFQIYDNGKNPKHVDPFFDEKNNDATRSELGAILYSSNILGNRRPRKMQVCINRINSEGKGTKIWQPAHRDEEMIQSFKHRTESAQRHLFMYENRQPRWNEDLGSYVLNFNKRVNLASVKNFQLISPSNDEHVVLQFGKATHDEFIMDLQWPMSFFQAFAVCLSSFDSKIACD